jgi:GNAT superfamily N-acetyltransferase
MRIRRTHDTELVLGLHNQTFPTDEWDHINDLSAMWLALDDDGTPVGFCIARRLTREPKVVFFQRVGVLPYAQGQGLQRRMIRVRERWARAIGATSGITYTTYENHESIVNLLRCGWRFYTPASPWVGANVHYFCKDLDV